MRYSFSRNFVITLSLAAMYMGMLHEAAAQTRRGNVSRASPNQNLNRTANVNQNVNRTANVNQNVNVNRNVNVDVDNGWSGGYYHRPVATAAVVTAGVAVTAAAIGSVAYSIPPSCVPVSVNGATYQQCGSTWYQPQYAGTQVTYVSVSPPR